MWACHPIAKPFTGPKGSERGQESGQEEPLSIGEDGGTRESEALRDLSRRKVRWGAMPLPKDLLERMRIESGRTVKHLCFGGEDDDIQALEDGQLYA